MAKKNEPPVLTVGGVELDLSLPTDRARLAELKAGAVRLRNFGASIDTIADKLGLTEEGAEHVLTTGLRELVSDDAEAVRARQQATLNDIRRAMYPGMVAGDEKAAGVIINVLKHESEIHAGVKSPQRVQVGVDQETFTTRVEEDIRELGMDPAMDVPLEEGGEQWSNT